MTFRRARQNENRILAAAVRENVREPLKLGLIYLRLIIRVRRILNFLSDVIK